MADFFQNSWIISKPKASHAYPRGRWMSIGKDAHVADRYVAAWLDVDGILHIFRDLKLSGADKLEGPATEVGGRSWKVVIERTSGTDNIKGKVDFDLSLGGEKNAGMEAGLAGVWGADAPPPIDDENPRR
jgi:hypothetical protein